MNRFARTLAFAAIAATSAFVLPAAQAANDAINPDAFVKMCDTDKDGMVSKAEVMKHVEKMFDKMDTKKMGKLDKKQVEEFLRSFNMLAGG
jgi:Ca2+-binding EF-hand superfamily protein